ncbi:nucleotide-binding universal stress UspA family protein [Saonia flava]|uniref:Nucleotide-binding universal stress UspA family protein n=1 Tax=Saonia flava TaxID=523696 RepID=A0A846QV75_9FLAO|nr:universal stress protein [Saonia flava]NJB72171.1 nucleotide-binding universal stress UspA family protein [Saonia flava]
MKHILLPTDFSENATNAINYAIGLFKNEECTFYILHAYHKGTSSIGGGISEERNTRLYKDIENKILRNLSHVVDEAKRKSNVKKHQLKTLAIADSLLNAIGKTVIDKGIDFIIMGTKGATGLQEVFLGSNTAKVIKEIDFCTLIAVPENYVFNKLNKIVFSTGYEHLYEEYELQPFKRIAKLWGSKIIVTHVKNSLQLTPQQTKAKKVLEKKLKELPYEMVDIDTKLKIVPAITKMVDENEEIGMIAILDYWHSTIEKLIHENVVNKMAFNSKVPLLVSHLVE